MSIRHFIKTAIHMNSCVPLFQLLFNTFYFTDHKIGIFVQLHFYYTLVRILVGCLTRFCSTTIVEHPNVSPWLSWWKCNWAKKLFYNLFRPRCNFVLFSIIIFKENTFFLQWWQEINLLPVDCKSSVRTCRPGVSNSNWLEGRIGVV